MAGLAVPSLAPMLTVKSIGRYYLACREVKIHGRLVECITLQTLIPRQKLGV